MESEEKKPRRRDLWERASFFIPNGSQTLSKCPDRFVNGVYPKFIKSGQGCYVEDNEGNVYTDYICALGPILLGYRNRYVDNAIKKQIEEQGVLFSLSHPKETTLAEMLHNRIPSAKKVKFFKTGSEALSAAVKVARAYTGKEKVVVCGYHGWHDWYSIVNDKKAGIPKCLEPLAARFKYNDLQSLKDLLGKGDIAAVIMEPVVYEEPTNDFLNEVKRLAHEHSAILIFDEVVTGFRFGIGGAQSYFKCVPDLSCFSKAMGNGFPIAALVGYADYMNVFERDDFFVSGTFGGDLVGISAAIAVIECLELKSGHALNKIWETGARLKTGFNEICRLHKVDNEVSCIGYPVRTMFKFPTVAHKAFFWQECLKQEVLFGYANFINSCHSIIDIEHTLNACETSIKLLTEVWNNPESRLEGDLPKEVLRMT